MHKPICAHCQVEYKMDTTGIYVVEMFLDPPQPYKIWSADLWKCPICKHEVVCGFGEKPLHEHHQAGFNESLARILVEVERGDTKIVNCYEFPFATIPTYDVLVAVKQQVSVITQVPVTRILEKGEK